MKQLSGYFYQIILGSCFSLLIFSHSALADSWQEATASYGMGYQLDGYRVSWAWHPQAMTWLQQQLIGYLDVSAAHWSAESATDSAINILAAAPVLR